MHDYLMTAPGDATTGGSVGSWDIHKPGARLITLTEQIRQVRDVAARRAKLVFKPCGPTSSATGHMVFTSMAKLGLLPVSTVSFAAEVTLTMD